MDNKQKNNVVVRMAPSPTGNLHIGGVRTALFNYLYARQNGGKFVLRIEDTDKERSKKEYEDNILESFKWLGLEYDELYRQSERSEVYRKYLGKLIESEQAYISQEEAPEDSELSAHGHPPAGGSGNSRSTQSSPARSEVIRFKNPNKKIVFEDMIRGQVEFDTTDLGDFVIAKSLEEPLYHLAVVVDDYEMGVTHVIRGEEHLSNTARQILIQESLGAPRPIYAHIPLILAPDRSKLSKRAGAVSTLEYRELGYLPEAVLNYLALLGWNPGTEQEIFSLDELIKSFDISKIQKGGAIFDQVKLKWVNKEHIRLQRDKIQETITKKIQGKYEVNDPHPEIVGLVFERIETLADIDEMLETGEVSYFYNEPMLDLEKIVWKKSNKETAIKHLEKLLTIIGDEGVVMKYAEAEGKGDVLWPLRYALSGREKSPDPFTLMRILGRETTEKRIKIAIETLR